MLVRILLLIFITSSVPELANYEGIPWSLSTKHCEHGSSHPQKTDGLALERSPLTSDSERTRQGAMPKKPVKETQDG